MSHVRHVLLLSTLVIAGCGGAEAADQAAREQAPLSDAEYQALVDDGAAAVKSALSGARGADDRAALQQALEASASDIGEAAKQLDSAQAPDAAKNANGGAATALDGLAEAFKKTAGRVESGEYCTAPAALAGITRSGAAKELRAAAKELEAGGFETGTLAPKQARTPSVKLKNGAVLARKGGAGLGEVQITNGGDHDGVVKLVAGSKRTTVHVRKNGSATVKQIPDGSYKVFFASGSSWDGKRNTFSRDCGFTAFDDKMKFTSGGGRYTRYSLTLNPVAGGNASSSPVDPGDFPQD